MSRREGVEGGRAATGGLLRLAVKARTALFPSPSAAEMRKLIVGLTKAVRVRLDVPVGVRELGAALCAEMSARRGGRPVELRFERFPDEFEVTGLWMEFPDFDLVIVEERAETVQQLVILGHELWHMYAGHCHQPVPGLSPRLSAAFEQGGTPIAARNGSHASDEREAEDFGHRLATAFRSWVVTGAAGGGPVDPADPVGRAIQASLGCRRPRG
ncbi:toxin-antitoxin system, toxin component [Streptomyces sp. NPDC002643]